MTGKYDDILCLPYHGSGRRAHMSPQDRAAQFSPFAALTGFDSAIEETGRLTETRPEWMDYRNDQLDQMLIQLKEQLPQKPRITLFCFIPDTRKAGGHSRRLDGHLDRIDCYRQVLRLTDGREIPLRDILRIESPDITEPPFEVYPP